MGVFVLRSLDLPPTLKQATLRPLVKSQVSEKVANGNPQCFRNSQKRVEADPLSLLSPSVRWVRTKSRRSAKPASLAKVGLAVVTQSQAFARSVTRSEFV